MAFAAGDAEEIAEASAAMFSGKIKGLEIARDLGRDVGDSFGDSLATGDLNGDDKADLAVADMGSNVHDLEIGDVVVGEGHIVCGQCRNCLAGRRHLCNATRGVGVNRPGAFAEYLCIPVTNVWHADPNIPMDILSIFDPFGNATHTTLSFKVLGEDVLITGAGPIGIMATAIAKHAGARYIVTTDMNPYRLELAKKMGATVALNIKEKSIAEVQKELGMKEGFDVGLEMSGSRSMPRWSSEIQPRSSTPARAAASFSAACRWS